MSSTQDPNVSNNSNVNSSGLTSVDPAINNTNSTVSNNQNVDGSNSFLGEQNQRSFSNGVNNVDSVNDISNVNGQIVNPLSQNNQTIPTTEIPMYEPEIIKDYNPYAQEPVSEPTEVVSNNFLSPLPQNSSTSSIAPIANNMIDNQNNNVFTSVSNPISQPVEPTVPNVISQASQTAPVTQTALLNQSPQQADLPQTQAVVAVVQPVNEYEGKKKRKNIFSIFFNFLPSIILIGLIALIVIIAKNFIDKTTITDFSEIGPAIIFEAELNKSTGQLEWLLLPPTPLGLVTDAPRDFKITDKVTITCPIKSSNDVMDIIQSVVSPKLGSCAFRAL